MRALASAAVIIVLCATGQPAPAAQPAAAAAAMPAEATGEPALRAGVVPESPPFVVLDHATLSGFTIDLFRAIGARLKRPVVFTQAPMPDLLADLAAGRVDVLAGPIQASPTRSAEMLFTQGYIWSQYQFGTRHGLAITSPADLRGKRLAVQSGTEYADWAELNARKYGFAVEKLPTLGQVLTAVRRGAADACLSDSPGLEAAAHEQDALDASLALPETRVQDAAAVARTDVELRDEIEDALTCLKLDGTVARLSKTWLGEDPGPEDLQRMVVPGTGVPGLSGYDPKPRKTHCGP
jgi:polar amino acid transport system substrate-binding protein